MQQYIGFQLNTGEYTLPIGKVREIVNLPSITRMPQAPAYIEGITNLRGSVIPIVNLKRLIRLEDDGAKGGKVVIVSSGRITYGILVDGITGVLNIDELRVEHPGNVLNEHREEIEGVARLDDRLVVLLDAKKLLPTQDLSLFEDIVIEVNEAGDTVEVTKSVQTMAGEMMVKELRSAKEFLEKKAADHSDSRYLIFDDMVNFINAVGNNEVEKAEDSIESIMKKGHGELFREVGKITRRLHDSVRSFKEAIDPRLKDIAATEMPNAVDRLRFVISKTEEAANRTMSIVEKYILTMDQLSLHIRNMTGPAESAAYLKQFMNTLEDDLTEILTTQSFQDLTGQTIKKVITLVADIEEELVRLIASFGVKVNTGAKGDACSPEKVSQSDVDDLLKDFGF